ncbi:hypothetical protein DPMN_090129 [Dreissena polymorpha]|uniref:Uncharacterized protein n=1 Tax=Dreissena polymorpha TaxID=45954 RepID=A0A9D4QY24_DREPO|nr:hypothetical protein DPMN_090129 [Dreissena polymorpha]
MAILTGFNIDQELVQVIIGLYGNGSSAVLINVQMDDFFKTTVGVLHGCLLSNTSPKDYLTEEENMG